MTKTAQDYLDEANTVVPRISGKDAVAHHSDDNAIFIDVRDSSAIAKTGTIAGALRIPRGFIEFAADENLSIHNKALKRDKAIYLVCAAGGMAALSGKTLKDMGFDNVTNIGGISEWIDAGGKTEA
jgi:rhodanese-related sulfurtransferase